MPPRFKPFTSFLTQGMNNTNKNINRMNMPGGGQVFGDPGDYMGGYEGSEGESGCLQGPVVGGGIGGTFNPGDYESPFGHSIEAIKPDPVSGYVQSPHFTSRPDYDRQQGQEIGFSGEWSVDPEWGGLAQQDMPTDELPEGWNWKFINGEWIPVGPDDAGTSDYEYGGGGFGGWQGPVTEPSTDYSKSFSLPDFAGGGGQGGQAAKRLYYPGTQGGFASVGSGIGGQQNILDDLLKKLQG